MSIQFLCVSCRKPIEVDDQWAMKIVQCPYCQEQVTAPGISTYQPEAPAMARQVAGGMDSSNPGYASGPAHGPAHVQHGYADTAQAPPRSNVVAVVSLVLAMLSLAMLVVTNAIAFKHLPQSFSPEATSQQQFEAQQKLVMEAIEKGESWVYMVSFAGLAGLVCWLGAVVCGLIGVSRIPRRGFAVAGLITAGIPIVIFFFGLLVR